MRVRGGMLCWGVFCWTASALAATVSVDPDGGLRKDGARWFPLGIYERPSDITRYHEIKRAGFDLVRAIADRSDLDKIGSLGLLGWVPLGAESMVHNETEALLLHNKISSLRDHPTLAIWELPDEALWNVWHLRNEAYGKERAEILDLIVNGNWDTVHRETLKGLYRNLIAAQSVADYLAVERTLAELWTTMGKSDRKVSTTLSTVPEEERRLLSALLWGYLQIRVTDSHHPIWQNHAPRNSNELLAEHACYCDLIGCDIYPYPGEMPQGHSDLAVQSLASVGAYTERFARLAPDKGILMVLQAFGWRYLHPIDEAFKETIKGRCPTYIASRFMAYDSIARGANGLCYWGSEYADPEKETWKGLAPVIRELASLREWFAEPEVHLPVRVTPTDSWGSQDLPVVMTARRIGNDWLILFVNEETWPRTVHVEFPLQFGGRKLYFLYENLYVEPASDSVIPLSFAPQGVRVLSTRNDLEVEELKGLNRLFEEPF